MGRGFNALVTFVSLAFSLSLVTAANASVVVDTHREALTVVRVEKLPPPFVAWTFAKASTVSRLAYEGSNGSWISYQAAFHETWSRAIGHRSEPMSAFLRSLRGSSEIRAARFGQNVASLAWDKDEKALAQAKRIDSNEWWKERTAPGLWQPTPSGFRAPLLPHWGEMNLWGEMTSAEIERGLRSPAVGSYIALNQMIETARIGSATSTVRTADQTIVAKFWAAGAGTVTPPGMWIEIASDLLSKPDSKLDQEDQAFVMMTLSQAMADAGVACWRLKYETPVWRPVTAIRAMVPGKKDWLPLLDTPPFPSYVSGHSSFSGAAAIVLETLLGSSQRLAVKSEAVSGHVRRFNRPWTAAHEAGMSRIYGGIHFAADNVDGLELGRRAACSVLRARGIQNCARP